MSSDDREKWDRRYAALAPGAAPTPFLLGVELPPPGRALDVAGGAGGNAIWLAHRGWDVTVADVSPVGLRLARAAAAAAAVTLTLVEVDLEEAPLPAGPFDLVLCCYYLQRSLYPSLAAALRPGALLVCVHPTRTNLERNPHPSAAYLLDDGELPSLVPGLEVLRHEEGWFGERHEARLVARKPLAGRSAAG